MRADLLTLLAQDGSKAIHDLRHLPAEEFDEIGADHLGRVARLLRATQYSCHVTARRLEGIVRRRADRTPPPEGDEQ